MLPHSNHWQIEWKTCQNVKAQVRICFLLEVCENIYNLLKQEAKSAPLLLLKGIFIPWYSLIGTAELRNESNIFAKSFPPKTGLIYEDELMESAFQVKVKRILALWMSSTDDQPRILTPTWSLRLYLVCLLIHCGFTHSSWTRKLCLKDYSRILIDSSMVWASDVNLASDSGGSLFLLHWAHLQMGNSSVCLY